MSSEWIPTTFNEWLKRYERGEKFSEREKNLMEGAWMASERAQRERNKMRGNA